MVVTSRESEESKITFLTVSLNLVSKVKPEPIATMTLALLVAVLKQESPDIARVSPQSNGYIETSASWLHLSRVVVA